jgi:hypothetical protein
MNHSCSSLLNVTALRILLLDLWHERRSSGDGCIAGVVFQQSKQVLLTAVFMYALRLIAVSEDICPVACKKSV